jgi:hypothetical protein
MPGIDSNTKLMLHMNSDFSDSSASGHTPTVNGATIDTGIKKFGAGSGKFIAGSSQRVAYPSSADFSFGTDPWTIDFWMRRNGAQGIYAALYSSNNNPSGSWDIADQFIISFNIGADDSLLLRHNHAGSPSNLITTNAASIPDTTQTHIAFVRDADTLISFVGGIKQTDTVSVAGKSFNSTGNGIVIGRQDSIGSYYEGHSDEWRISKGIARWTSDFTPPSSEYTSDVTGRIMGSLAGHGGLAGIGGIAGQKGGIAG